MVRKFLVGILCGAVLFAGVSVSAAEIKSILVGKKVEGTMTVTINGKALEKEAAIINGSSYLPVRDIVDALGGEVSSVKDRTIALSTEKRDAKVSTDLAEQARLEQDMLLRQWEKQNTVQLLNSAIDQLNNQIGRAQDRKAEIQNQIDSTEYYYRVGLEPQPYKESEQYQVKLDEIAKEEAEILRLQAELTALQNELAVLEAELEAEQ